MFEYRQRIVILSHSVLFRFPLQFHPFLKLLKSLAGDKDSAAKVFPFFSGRIYLSCSVQYDLFIFLAN